VVGVSGLARGAAPRAADHQEVPRALEALRARLAHRLGLTPPPPPPPPPAPGEARVTIHKGVSFALAYCPPGDLVMGAPAALPAGLRAQAHERPAHPVRVSVALWVGQTPVTQEQYEAVLGARPSRAQGARLPVEQVSWLDAVRFCNALSALEGLEPVYAILAEGDAKAPPAVQLNRAASGYRLPSEAEWERAARARAAGEAGAGEAGAAFAGGGALAEVAHCGKQSAVAPVAGRRPNALGLYDLSGLVWEWCADAWDERAYKGREGHQIVDPLVYDERWPRRAARGGSWADEPSACAVWARRGFEAGARSDRLGFRVVRAAP